jgi:ligand-binding sensor domain-containing protein/signal transduction histidine kinase
MRVSCTAILLLILHGHSFSQVHYFKKYTTGTGLIQNTVKTIKQDKLGRLWIGTAEGLSIYDGEEFINYSEEEGLKSTVINCFYEVNDSIMLVGSNGNGVYVFLKPAFGKDTLIQIYSGPEYLVDNNVNNILRDWENNFWFCTDAGVTRWRMADVLSERIEVNHYGKEEGFPGLYTYGTVDLNNKIIWLGTEIGLIKSDGKRFSLEKEFTDSFIYSIYVEKDYLIIGTSERIIRYKNGSVDSFLPVPISRPLQHFSTRLVTKDSKGVYWFATSKGLLRYDGANFSVINHHYGLDEDFLFSVLEDKEENIWIGSVNGLFKFSEDSFTYIPRDEKSSVVHNFARDRSGNLWLSTPEGIYNFENNRMIYSKINMVSKGHRIYKVIFPEKTNEAWVLTSGGILQLSVNDTSGAIKLIKQYGKDELAPDYNYSMHLDKAGNAWVTSKAGKLFLITNGRMKLLNAEGIFRNVNFPDDVAVTLYTDSRNNTWLGYFQQGLFKITSEAVIRYTRADGFASETVRCIYEDSQSNIWIGTRFNGVFKYSNGQFTQYTTKDGLSSNWVRTIVADNTGNVWFGTAKGVTLFNGKIWKVYEDAKGIKAGEVVASAIGNDGTVYFSASNGLYFYSPKGESKNVQPVVFIKKFQFIDGRNADYFQDKIKNQHFSAGILFTTDNKVVHASHRKFLFGHNENSFIIEFASSNFKNERKTLYAYKLEGFDSEWYSSTKRNYISYVNLPAGRYRFLVKAINSDGLWSERPSEISFVITPPFWETWWFRMLIVCSLVGAVAFVTTLVNRYHLKQAVEIERMRTEIATDLHDDIGSNLTSISIFSQLVKREIKRGTLASTAMLDKIENSSRSLIDSLNDIVWSINPDNDSLEDAILKLEDFAVELLDAKNIEAYISISEELNHLTLPMNKRRNLLLIFKEMVNNVVKHAQASKVFIEMKIDKDKGPKTLYVSVKDNGTGFCVAEVKKGNGLKNIKKRASLIDGEFSIDSAKDKGTKYELYIPV